MNRSESIIEISKALLNFSKEVTKIGKTASNPFFNSKYAPLPKILEAIEMPLQNSSLVISQHPMGDNQMLTLLVHADSGEYFESCYGIKPSKEDPQALASAVTYARRCAIGAILNLNIDEDDDGNGASGRNTGKKQPTPTPTPTPTPPKKEAAWLNPNTDNWESALKYLSDGGSIEVIKKKYKISKENEALLSPNKQK